METPEHLQTLEMMPMIPKTIHYCWFGGKPLPESARRCIDSWHKYLPDYEIKEWNEGNFDVNSIAYTAEAYKARKYAFVSDYARFWVLYRQGGIYFDTDVEVVRGMDDIVRRGPFVGCENEAQAGTASAQPGNALGVNPGLGMGATPGLGLLGEVLEVYKGKHYILPDGTPSYETVVDIVTDLLCRKGLANTAEVQCVEGLWIYPKEYFCPIDYKTSVCKMTQETRTIHHYAETWLPWYMKAEGICWQKVGLGKQFYLTRLWNKIVRTVRRLKR